MNEVYIKKSIKKISLDESIFLRITNFDAYGNIINIKLYQKINNRYKPVDMLDIPFSMINSINTSSLYKSVSKKEESKIINKLNMLKKNILKKNSFNLGYIKIGIISDIYYILGKDKNSDFYGLNSIKVNEIGEIVKIDVLDYNEIVYVLIDLLKDENIGERLFLIDINKFSFIKKVKEYYVVSFYSLLSEEENEQYVKKDNYLILMVKNNSFQIILSEEANIMGILDKEDFNVVDESFLKMIF
ncbi:hypothetical protein KGF51_12360 [Clostridioides sp. ZZV14-6045]|uniref:hypothetical protein n=1 Tax=Clostridioides sp. ZZV14-6045 TaxID=2811489 RepID=UPI001D0FDBE0|nr:hypothetical protein [Clostridioides sp. ZZV14-6045]